MIVHYQITSAATGTTAGAGSLQVVAPGRVVGVVFRFRATGGASPGFYSTEVALNNTSQSNAEASNPIRTASIAAATFHTASTSPTSGNSPFIPTNWKVSAGDTLSLGITQTGTAASSCGHLVDVYVDE